MPGPAAASCGTALWMNARSPCLVVTRWRAWAMLRLSGSTMANNSSTAAAMPPEQDDATLAFGKIGVPGAHQAPALRIWRRPR